jgi:predicted Zn-dependent protease
MKAARKFTWAGIVLFLFVLSCAKAPITGRSQLNLIPDHHLNSMARTQYTNFLATHEVSKSKEDTEMVARVGTRIQRAIEAFFKERGESHVLEGYAWEFNLIEDPQVNAWCMPGGRVVVYTGLLSVTQTEPGLAVVMGHEIAHAVAGHGSERMSQGLLTEFGGMALEAAMKDKPAETRALFMTAYGLGSQVGVLLPYSRLHESEADYLGLIFMAIAGYDPNEAIPFWERMAAEKGGAGPPEFLSTHPSDETRIASMREKMPEAMGYYKPIRKR